MNMKFWSQGRLPQGTSLIASNVALLNNNKNTNKIKLLLLEKKNNNNHKNLRNHLFTIYFIFQTPLALKVM